MSSLPRHPGVHNGLPQGVVIASPAAPDGMQWKLVSLEEPGQNNLDRPTSVIQPFKYDKLTVMNKRIRLLKLNAGERRTSEVECELFEAEIAAGNVFGIKNGEVTADVVEYEALSWSWGKSTPDDKVLIRKGNERRWMRATEDLVTALRHLRYPAKDRILWIDAICINQQSVDEKNHQVQMMAQIYSYATSVCIWLGKEDRESKLAIDFIKNEILKLEQFDDLCTDESNSQKWQSLLLLMQRQWFFRRWVVQEIALARDAVIYCGPDKISWKDFSVAVELFVEVETATHRLSEVMKKDPAFYHVPGWFEYVSALGASLLVEATGMIFRYYKPDKSKQLPQKPPMIGEGVLKSSDGNNFSAEPGSASENEEIKCVWDDWNIPMRPLSPAPPAVSTAGGGLVGGMETGGEGKGKEASMKSAAAGVDEVNVAKGGNVSNGSNGCSGSKGGKGSSGNSGNNGNKLADASDEVTSIDPHDPISQRRPLLSLEYLVSRLSIFKATEPRDAIYALLAIANDGYPAAEGPDDDAANSLRDVLSVGGQKPFPVNYGRAYADVCQDFIDFCISRSDKSHALDIICRPWAPESKPGVSIHHNKRPEDNQTVEYAQKAKQVYWDTIKKRVDKARSEDKDETVIEDIRLNTFLMRYFPDRKKKMDMEGEMALPSWIPGLDGAPFAMHLQAGIHITKMGRKNADPLVGLPNSRNYDAAQGKPVDMAALRFYKRRRQAAHCMEVKGFVLETVKAMAPSSQSGNVPEEWPKMAGWEILDDPEKDDGPPEEFWRTLVADRGRDSKNPPYYYKKACKESVYKGGLPSGAVNTSDLINNERNSIVAQFCRRVQAVIWNRSLFKTAKGNLGIASKSVKVGDLVCILYGCSVPVILRKHKKPPEELSADWKDDERMLKAEEILRGYMGRHKSIRRRKKSWNSIPDTRPAERSKREKRKEWSKEEIRADLPRLNRKVARKLRKLRKHEKKKGEHRSAIELTAPSEHYYKFLGECYLHGMMDGEAMQRKSHFDEQSLREWQKKRKEPLFKCKISEKAKLYRQEREAEADTKNTSKVTGDGAGQQPPGVPAPSAKSGRIDPGISRAPTLLVADPGGPSGGEVETAVGRNDTDGSSDSESDSDSDTNSEIDSEQDDDVNPGARDIRGSGAEEGDGALGGGDFVPQLRQRSSRTSEQSGIVPPAVVSQSQAGGRRASLSEAGPAHTEGGETDPQGAIQNQPPSSSGERQGKGRVATKPSKKDPVKVARKADMMKARADAYEEFRRDRLLCNDMIFEVR